jgi:predicted porin
MKKGILALAVLGAFSGAALAQSSVTLYGIVDVGYQYNKVPTDVGSPGQPRIDQKGTSAINGGYQSGNRWGLRGAEDLGGDMKAIFTLESGFDIDRGTSAQGSRLFGRQAWLGLQTKLGSVVAGRLATFSSGTGSFDMFGRVDPFSTGFGLNSLGSTFISANALRVDNAIAYQSPNMKVLGDLKFGVGYSTRIDGAEQTPSARNTTAFISGVNWEGGPLFLSLTYDSIDPSNERGGSNQKHLQVGGVWTISNFTINAAYADQSNIGGVQFQTGLGSGTFVPLPSGLAGYDATAWMVGGTWTLGAWKFMGSYQWSNAKGKSVTVDNQIVNFEPDYNVWGLAATYNLSRRTNLYAGYGHREADGTLNSDAFNNDQFAIGMRHLF